MSKCIDCVFNLHCNIQDNWVKDGEVESTDELVSQDSCEHFKKYEHNSCVYCAYWNYYIHLRKTCQEHPKIKNFKDHSLDDDIEYPYIFCPNAGMRIDMHKGCVQYKHGDFAGMGIAAVA